MIAADLMVGAFVIALLIVRIIIFFNQFFNRDKKKVAPTPAGCAVIHKPADDFSHKCELPVGAGNDNQNTQLTAYGTVIRCRECGNQWVLFPEYEVGFASKYARWKPYDEERDKDMYDRVWYGKVPDYIQLDWRA
jgi:hypothetical protein